MSNTDDTLTGTHTTPVQRYVDNLSFKFENDGSNCKVLVRNDLPIMIVSDLDYEFILGKVIF